MKIYSGSFFFSSFSFDQPDMFMHILKCVCKFRPKIYSYIIHHVRQTSSPVFPSPFFTGPFWRILVVQLIVAGSVARKKDKSSNFNERVASSVGELLAEGKNPKDDVINFTKDKLPGLLRSFAVCRDFTPRYIHDPRNEFAASWQHL